MSTNQSIKTQTYATADYANYLLYPHFVPDISHQPWPTFFNPNSLPQHICNRLCPLL